MSNNEQLFWHDCCFPTFKTALVNYSFIMSKRENHVLNPNTYGKTDFSIHIYTGIDMEYKSNLSVVGKTVNTWKCVFCMSSYMKSFDNWPHNQHTFQLMVCLSYAYATRCGFPNSPTMQANKFQDSLYHNHNKSILVDCKLK